MYIFSSVYIRNYSPYSERLEIFLVLDLKRNKRLFLKRYNIVSDNYLLVTP